MTHAVTLLPGDGIGPEVVAAACRVVDAAGVAIDWDTHLVGIAALERGAAQPLPEAVVEAVRATRFALKGPVSTPAGRQAFRSVNVELRRRLDLFAQARRCRTWPGTPAASSPFDLLVVRETTEDLYAGVEAAPGSTTARAIVRALAEAGHDVPEDAGLSIKYSSPRASERAIEAAFRLASSRSHRTVTVAHKATVMRETDARFVEVAATVGARYPGIPLDDILIDNLCAALVRDPGRFGVLIMPNMYGDIVSDLAGALSGGVGLVPGANIGEGVTMFEPAHGSAPRYAGLGRANPTAAILSAAMLLEALGEVGAAERIERAVARVIGEGRSVTYDLKPARADPSAVTTDEMADAVAELVAGGEP